MNSCGFLFNGRFSGELQINDSDQFAFTLLPPGVYYADDIVPVWTWTQNGPAKRGPTTVPTVPTVTDAFTFAIGPTRLYESCDPQAVDEEPEEEVAEDKTAKILRATAYVATSLTVLTIVALLVF